MAREYEIIHKEIKDADGVTCYIKTGEIVRGKDCIHRPWDNGGYWPSIESPDRVCPFLSDEEYHDDIPPDDEFYCRYGERKNNG